MSLFPGLVTPAKAGTQLALGGIFVRWIPAFAGMTKMGAGQ